MSDNQNNDAPENPTGDTPVESKKSTFSFGNRAVFKPVPEKHKGRDDWIGLAPYHSASKESSVDAWKPMDQDDMPHARDWVMAVDDAQYNSVTHDYPYVTVNAGGNFKLSLSHTTKDGKASKIGIAPHTGDVNKVHGSTRLTGKSFINVVRKKRNSDSAELIFPLPHTGIWVSVKPAKDLRWLSFDTERAERRITVGRDTNGLLLSARSGYEQQEILDFCIEHITDVNVKEYTPENLLGYIDQLDIPIIIWGFCAAQYVTGYPVRIPCMVDPSKCNHVSEVWAMLTNMGWMDNDRFTEEQLEFISDYRVQRTHEEVQKYRESRKNGISDIVTLSDGTRVTLSVPYAADSLAASRRWVTDVTNEIDQSLRRSGRDKNVGEHRRLTHLLRGMEETQMREYVPWISKVEAPLGEDGLGSENVGWSDKVEDIELWCEEVSSDHEITKEIYEAVKKFMSDRTSAVVGYPAFKCPKCQGGYDIGDEKYMEQEVETIIPIDPIKYFLASMARRLENTKQLFPTNPTGR